METAVRKMSSPLSPFYAVRTPVHEMLPPTCRVDLPTSVNLAQQTPHRHAQRFVSLGRYFQTPASWQRDTVTTSLPRKVRLLQTSSEFRSRQRQHLLTALLFVCDVCCLGFLSWCCCAEAPRRRQLKGGTQSSHYSLGGHITSVCTSVSMGGGSKLVFCSMSPFWQSRILTQGLYWLTVLNGSFHIN